MRLCGHAPDTAGQRSEVPAYVPTGIAWESEIAQPIGRIHHQPILPDCTGEAISACIEAQTGQLVSGVDLWREGLRRCGESPAQGRGLAFSPALVGVARRGWTDYREGEELEVPPDLESLEQGLEACDTADRVMRAYRVPTGTGAMTLAAIDDALQNGWGVVFGALVGADYKTLRANAGTVGSRALGYGIEPHAQRIAGRVRDKDGMRSYLVQNSWGEDWGGVWLCGVWRPGCALVAQDAILASYDVRVLEVRL